MFENNIRIGVFPAGSEVALEINRALKDIRQISLVGLSSTDDYGDAAFDAIIKGLPFLGEKTFISKIASVVREKQLDFLVPAMDEVAYVLKSHEAELGCEVVYADLSTAEILRRKSATYEMLHDYIPIPKVFSLKDGSVSEFPIFTKPDIGYGSHKEKKLQTRDEARNHYFKHHHSHIYLEYLPGEELTIDCFTDAQCDLLFCGPRIRSRIRQGISVASKPVPLSAEIDQIAHVIAKQLQLKGCWFFQLKKAQCGTYKLLEVASRVSGSMAMYRMIGVNFILLDIYQRLGLDVSVPKTIKGDFRIERAFDVKLVGSYDMDSLYIDLDDCLINESGVNIKAVSFVYACINKGYPVYLVTRHAHDLQETLQKYRLQNIFNQVFHITDGSPKHKVIKHAKAIFVDDSFQERVAVAKALDIRVLAVDMLDEGCL